MLPDLKPQSQPSNLLLLAKQTSDPAERIRLLKEHAKVQTSRKQHESRVWTETLSRINAEHANLTPGARLRTFIQWCADHFNDNTMRDTMDAARICMAVLDSTTYREAIVWFLYTGPGACTTISHPCSMCERYMWWRLATNEGGPWMCGVCHPVVPAMLPKVVWA